MSTPSDRPKFRKCDRFIETAFDRRMQELLDEALQNHTSHVITALPGSGKTSTTADFVGMQGAEKRHNELVRLPAISTSAPVSNSNGNALGIAIAECFGIVPKPPWALFRVWLAQQLVREQVRLLAIDDAHELSIQHLRFLKELIDRLALPPYNYRLAFCLIAASYGSENHLVTTLSRPEMIWEQFRTRLNTKRPFCPVPGHTEAEVRDILGAFEVYYRAQQLPNLQLVRWTGSIHGYLTHPILDPTGSRRATMLNITNLVNIAAEEAYRQGLDDIPPDILYQTAQYLALGSRQEATIGGDTSGQSSELTVALVKPKGQQKGSTPVE